MSVKLTIQPHTIHNVIQRKKLLKNKSTGLQRFVGEYKTPQHNRQEHEGMEQIEHLRKKRLNFFQIC